MMYLKTKIKFRKLQQKQLKIFLLTICVALCSAYAEGQQIKGTVIDESGVPLPGVSIIEKGTSNGTTTDFDGNFTINISIDKTVLVFSYLGFVTQEIPVIEKTNINITLKEDLQSLDEVVIIGYGTARKGDLTGAISSVKGEKLTQVAGNNIGQALQGRMSGVQVSQSSGAPGASSAIKIRGVGSVSSNNSPLVLIDGVPGSLNLVTAHEIASLTVLKDAAAASIYGNRAANGVILITTKRGKKGDIKVSLNTEYGVQSRTDSNFEFLDTFEWVEYQHAISDRAGTSHKYVGDLSPENLPNIDWLDHIFNTAPTQTHALTISGGSEASTYALNLAYLNQEGILGRKDGDNSFTRLNTRLNLDSKISSTLKVGANFSYIRSENKTNLELGLSLSGGAPPVFEPYNVNGEIVGDAFSIGVNQLSPAANSVAKDDIRTTNRTQVDLYAELSLLKDFKWKTSVSGRISDVLTQDFRNKYEYYPIEDPDHLGAPNLALENSILRNTHSGSTWLQFNSILNYSKNFENHHVDALFGIEVAEGKSKLFYAKGEGFPNDDLRVLDVSQSNFDLGGNAGESRISSQFARVNYNYDNRYFVQFNVRRDGSYIFAPENRWGVFPSVSLGWRLSDEKFLDDSEIISNMKLRSSYGTLGNSAIGAFRWLSTINLSASTPLGSGSTQSIQQIAFLNSFANSDIKWEKSATLNFGLDLSLFDNDLKFVLDVYDRETTDMLLTVPVPLSSGFSNTNQFPFVNIGAVDNKGWELYVDYSTTTSKGFSYGANFNLSQNTNEVTDLGGQAPIISTFYRTMEGEAINSYWGFKTDGVWNNQAEIDANPSRGGVRPGDIRVVDLNSVGADGEVIEGVPDGEITIEDMTVIGNAIPKLNYGFGANAAYKGFDFSILFQGEAGKNAYYEPVFSNDIGKLDFVNIQKSLWENRTILNSDFTEVVTEGRYPAIGTATHQVPSDVWVEKADYLRVKNIQIGYTLPEKVTQKLSMNNLRIYISATNPFTFTDYRGLDPELNVTNGTTVNTGVTRGGNAYPQTKTFAFGLNVSF